MDLAKATEGTSEPGAGAEEPSGVGGVEPTCAILHGAAVEHALKGSNGVQAVGLPDGPSRSSDTHQRPSILRRASMT